MTEQEIEKDADECWLLWRKSFLSVGVNPSTFSESEKWQHAYRAGIALGQEIEREGCASAAERCDSKHIAAIIRFRTTLLNPK